MKAGFRIWAAGLTLALCMPAAVWGADGTAGSRPQIDYGQILDITQAGNMTEGRPQNPIQNEQISAPETGSLKNQNIASEIILRDENGKEIQRIPVKDQKSGYSFISSSTVVSQSSSVISGKSSQDEENSNYGPGVSGARIQVEVKDDAEIVGPEIREVTMNETFHEEYDVYTESIDGQFFIYTNVENGGITDQAVYLDIPQNISFTAEKDGVSISYMANQQLTERGTYLFRFTAVKDPDKSLSEQVIYETTFNFRIQEKSAKATESSDEVEYYGSSHSTQMPYPVVDESEAVPDESMTEAYGMDGVSGDTAGADGAESVAGEEIEAVSGENDFAETENGETEDLHLPAAEAYETDDTAGYTVSYDQQRGMYQMNLSEQRYFRASVPNGMLSNTGVYMDFSGMAQEEMGIEVFQGGQPFTMPDDGTFNQVGNYTLRIPHEGENAIFSFRLVGDAVSGLDSYTIPAGMKVTGLTRDGEDILAELTGTRQRIDFSRDGQYVLSMTNQQGSTSQVTVVIDHVPPQFSTSLENGAAVLYYDSDDVVRIDVTSREETQHYDGLSQISEPGIYRIDVYDAAGNMSSQTVTVPRRVNAAAVIAVILLIGLAAAAVIFLQKTKKDFNVK